MENSYRASEMILAMMEEYVVRSALATPDRCSGMKRMICVAIQKESGMGSLSALRWIAEMATELRTFAGEIEN